MMDLKTILPGVAGAMGASVAMSLILRSIRPGAELVDGAHVMRYGRSLKLLTVGFWVCYVGAFVGAFFARPDGRLPLLITISSFLLMILVFHIEMFNVRVVYDETGVRTFSPWRRRRVIPWSAFRRVYFSAPLKWYVVETDGYGCVRLHVFLSGVETFLDEIERRGLAVVRNGCGGKRVPH